MEDPKKKEVVETVVQAQVWALTMVDEARAWPEIVSISSKKVNRSRYLWILSGSTDIQGRLHVYTTME